jgi:hypothetical protein
MMYIVARKVEIPASTSVLRETGVWGVGRITAKQFYGSD